MARKPKQTVENVSPQLLADESLLEAIAQPNVEVDYRSRCGGALRSAREKQGLSTQEIASRLRLSSKQIEALEADNFAALPEPTIVKGFIRNYAKQLMLQAEPLIDAYNVIVPTKAPQSFTLQPNADMKVTPYEKPNAARYALFGLAALLCLGAWFFYENYVQKPSPVNPTAVNSEPAAPSAALELPAAQAPEPLPEVALPAAERAAEAVTLPVPGQVAPIETVPSTTNTASTPIASTPISLTPGMAKASSAPIASGAALAPQPPAVGTSQVAASQFETKIGMSKLEFNANQETWVNVVDANGKEIYSKTLFAGNREVIEAKSPLNVTVGNALGATLSVNGKSVDLAPHTRTNVAHLKID